MTNRLLAAALAAGFSLSPLTHAGTHPDDVPALGYSLANRDTHVDPRQDFYRYAAGNWLKKTEIAPSDPDVGGFTLLAHNLDKQLLTLIKDDQRCFVAWTQMWAYKGRSERLRYLVSVDVHAIASVRAVAPLLHLDAFHQAFGTRPGDAMWRAPEQRVVIW